MGLVKDIKNLIVGLVTTGKHLTRKNVTIQYPTQKREIPERSRGIVVLLSDKETGELNCTTCLLCAKACPTAAIHIDFEKGEKGKRILKDFVVDHGLCCFCGLCEESCNFVALKMDTAYEFSTENKDDLIWHTDKLQEMGRNTPYTPKPKKKKPVAKKPAGEAKPETPKPEAAKTETKEETKAPESEKPAVDDKPSENKKAEAPESTPAKLDKKSDGEKA